MSKMNVHDRAAIEAAGWGNPGDQFNPEAEIEVSQIDAAMIEVFNKANKVDPSKPASAVLTKKGNPMSEKPSTPKNPKPKVQEVPEKPNTEVEEPEVNSSEPEEGSLDLSDDPKERLKQIAKALQELNPKAPGEDQLSNWKQMHGDVFILYMFDQAFVFRYLKRAEWIKMNLDESFQNMRQDQVEEYIFDRCVLWPIFSVVEKAKLAAGTVPSLSEQIRINSMFVDPARLSQLTIKL